jgi:hypothetical protein
MEGADMFHNEQTMVLEPTVQEVQAALEVTDEECTAWWAKLHQIVHKIHLCKSVLAKRKLNIRQAGVAAELVRAIETRVQTLGESTTGAMAARHLAWSHVVTQLEDLGLLCDELISTVYARQT